MPNFTPISVKLWRISAASVVGSGSLPHLVMKWIGGDAWMAVWKGTVCCFNGNPTCMWDRSENLISPWTWWVDDANDDGNTCRWWPIYKFNGSGKISLEPFFLFSGIFVCKRPSGIFRIFIFNSVKPSKISWKNYLVKMIKLLTYLCINHVVE